MGLITKIFGTYSERELKQIYPIVDKIEKSRALNAASEAACKGMSANIDMSMAVTVSGKDLQEMDRVEHTKIDGKGQIKMIMDKNPQMAFEMKLTADGQEEEAKMWLRDGWMYTQSGETAQKVEAPELAELYQELMSAGVAKNSGTSMLLFLKNISEKTSGSDKIYTLEINDAFANLMNSMVAQVLQESGLEEDVLGTITIDNSAITYTVKNSTLRNANLDLGLSLGMKAEDAEVNVGISLQFEMDIVASGSAVKITYPDFSDFEEVIGGADGPTGIYGALIL